MFGTDPLGSNPYGTSLWEDFFIESPFGGVLSDGDAELIFLVDLAPYDPVGAATVERGFADYVLPVYFADTGRNFPNLATVAIVSENNLFTRLSGVGGAGSQLSGTVVLDFADGTIDDLSGFFYDGRLLQILAGVPEFEFFQFQPVMKGTARDASWNENQFTIALRDPTTLLQKELQGVLFAGTGTYEGGDDLKGKPKPITLGAAKNVPGLLTDNAFNVFVFHFDSVKQFDAVWDKGTSALTASPDPSGGPVDAGAPAGDIARLGFADVYAWTAISDPAGAAGQYITDISRGVVRTWSTPAGSITADLLGDDAGPGGYISKIGAIVKRLVEIAGDPVEILSGADTLLDTKQPAPVSFYQGASALRITEAIDSLLLETLGGFRTFTREGQLNFDRFEFGTSVDTIEETDVLSIARDRTDVPPSRISLGYGPNYKIQDGDTVASAGDADRKDFVAEAFRRVFAPDTAGQDAILAKRLTAAELEVDTLFADESDAQAEADRRATLLSADPDRYNVVVRKRRFQLRPGETVTLNYPSREWGISSRDFIIVGIREDSTTLETTLRLWG